jgi:hypothetical protein
LGGFRAARAKRRRDTPLPAARTSLLKQTIGAPMQFPVRPGKVTCAGIVAIMMVLPNSIWRGPDAEIQHPKKKSENVERRPDSFRETVKFSKAPR